MTEEEFAEKVEIEGDVLDALLYGLKADVLPDGELKRTWEMLEQAWKSVDQWIDYAQDIVDELLEREAV